MQGLGERWQVAGTQGVRLRGEQWVGCCAQVRTQTLVKSAIIQVDATPFRQFYQQHYGVEVGRRA